MIVIPEAVWLKVFAAFRKTRKKVEQVCFLDGIRGNDLSVITTLTFPDAELYRGYFQVSAVAMEQAGEHLLDFGLRRIAQIHTHPTEWVGHSPYDDAHAYSQAMGAVSIVLPNYGRTAPSLDSCGVHVRTSGGWQELGCSEKRYAVRIVPDLLDFRRKV